ncbi:MAG: O-antigen ligase family protein [Candidatus Coatesbacteria bacterium]|nr:O-antigen ligase family protein [Candidatus Coatesbacteria bacterium]
MQPNSYARNDNLMTHWRSKAETWAEALLEFLLMALILIAPFEKHTAQILDTAIYGSLGVLAVILVARGRSGRMSTPLDIPIFALFLIAVLSAIFSVDGLMSLASIKRTMVKIWIVYYLFIYAATGIERIKRLIFTYLIGSVAVSSYGILAFLDGSGVIDGRAHSTFYHPTRLANYMTFAVSISFCLVAYYRESRAIKSVLYAIFGLSSICLVLTASRGANLGLLLGFLIVFGPRNRRLWAVIAVIIALTIAIIPFQSSHLHFLKGAELVSAKTNISAILGERQYLWLSGLEMAKDHPILGIGYGRTFNSLYQSDYAKPEAGQDHSSAHNVIIEVALEMGIFGLAAFMWLHVLIFREGFQLVRSRPPKVSFARTLATGVLVALFAIACNGMVNYFYKDRLILVYWFFVAIIFALRRLQVREFGA